MKKSLVTVGVVAACAACCAPLLLPLALPALSAIGLVGAGAAGGGALLGLPLELAVLGGVAVALLAVMGVRAVRRRKALAAQASVCKTSCSTECGPSACRPSSTA